MLFSDIVTLSDLLVANAKEHGNREFLFFERQPVIDKSGKIIEEVFRQTLTFKELNDRVNQACRYLSSLGLNQGDVFNLHLPNCPSFLILWFAGARLGAVMMPTNILASVDEMSYLLEHSGSKIAFTTIEHLEALNQCQNNFYGLEQVILSDCFSAEPDENSLEALLEKQSTTPWQCQASETDMVAIMYTSGTTSKPKGVMVTHANYLTAGRTVANAIELTESDRNFIVLPLFHGNAQYYSTMSALLRGASIALMDRFSASQFFDKCIEYRCTVASLFAAPIRMLLAQAKNSDHKKNVLRIVLYAQNLIEHQMLEWQQRFEAPLCQLWGMTETMGPPLMNPLRGERRNWTIGKPSGNYEISLVDDSGNTVEIGQEGEITVKGTPGISIMAGYFRNPEATNSTIQDGWLYSGDNAVLDDEGYFRFVDRKKDMIKRSGENISTGEVENVLLQHPAVFECAVIGLPDELRDESIVGVVVLHPGSQVLEAELIEFCSGKLTDFKVPQQIIIDVILPKTSVGKIQKHLIRNALITT